MGHNLPPEVLPSVIEDINFLKKLVMLKIETERDV